MHRSASSVKVGHTLASHRILYACACIMCDCMSCVLIPPSEASVHHSPGYGLFEESPSHMLTQICAPSSLGPLHPAFASSNVPPSPSPSPHLPPLHHTEPSPLPASPSLVTGMLTGRVYNKIEDEVLTLSVVNISTWQSPFRLSFIAHDHDKKKTTAIQQEWHFKTMLLLGCDAPICAWKDVIHQQELLPCILP